jgi:hypothetical protein
LSGLAALTACAILLALAVFQIALVAGAPLGHFAWGGSHRVLPGRLRAGSVVAVVIYAAIAAVTLQRAGVVTTLPPSVADAGIWVATAYLALGIPLNAISRSRAERLTMTPIVLVLFVLLLVVALGL